MFVIRTVLIGMFLMLPLLATAQTVQLRPLKPTPSKPVLYELQMQVTNVLSPKAAIEIQFPSHFDLTPISIAGSNNLKGGIRFQVDSTTVILERTGLGPQVPSGENVSVIFGPIAKKTTAAATDSVAIRIFFEGLQKRSNFQAFKIGIR